MSQRKAHTLTKILKKNENKKQKTKKQKKKKKKKNKKKKKKDLMGQRQSKACEGLEL